ncbi:hypothetical protein B296_00045668 [Ensete ventricosum]|uniref:Uncharacterized protein n=1 Tax=Ensete ventricosum TaxID=4639 RepID=A0A426WXC7_ENSVE|nr:hypothetical protein B296_00045668 [Ensete ventricosum]
MEQFVGSGGVRKGTSPSPAGAGALYAFLGSLDGPSRQGDSPGKLLDPCLGNLSFPFVGLLTVASFVQSQHFQMVLFDRVHDAGRLITFIDYRVKQERGEELLRREASEKELQEVQGHLGDAQQLLREVRTKAQRMDDELLQDVKDLESARAELPRQSVIQYNESLGFKEGLKRMGRVTYEYGYRVALARFRARHPDANIEEDPFTIHPEDDLVPMERQQDFDDSVPPEP